MVDFFGRSNHEQILEYLEETNLGKRTDNSFEKLVIRKVYPPRFAGLIAKYNVHCKKLKMERVISNWNYFITGKELRAKAKMISGGFRIYTENDVKHIILPPLITP